MAEAPTRSSRHMRAALISKMTRQTTEAGRLEKFPDFPPRDDMQNSLHLDQQAHQATLRRHFGSHDTTIVLSEIPVRQSPGQREGHRIPDLLIAFDVDFNLAVVQMGYSIRGQGKPPDFVLKIASPSTGRRDYTRKRNDYAAFGIPEYWRFDPSGGQHTMHPWSATCWWKERTSLPGYRRLARDTSTGTATRWAWTSAGKTAG